MLNATHARLAQLAGDAGWDSYTLLLLISRWLDGAGQATPLLDHLDALAREEGDSPGED